MGKKPSTNHTAINKDQPHEKQLLLFKWMSVLTPFVFLILLEVILRVFDYGHNTDLFVKFPPDEHYMVMNYYASDKFFPDTLDATKGNQEIFAINKSPNTFRVFVLGESTTLGFPFRPNGSFHRWLQYRLMHEYPDKNIEIINLSLTAVNSYTVLDFGKQVAQYQPDAVLIYTGHNEYYGALGIGSTTYVGSNRFLIQTLVKLREFKVVQLFNNFIKKIAALFAKKPSGDRQSLMEDMAARQHIKYGSADYRAGISQFTENITELCRTLNDEKVPTYLSNVVSNEKDLPPFISEGDGPNSANWNYKQGQLAYRDSNFSKAKEYFDKARELDELRFRAPEAINTSITKIAGQFPYVHLVDSKSIFEKYSPHGILGSETIEEHVHPDLLGYAIMSEAFYQAMQKQQLINTKPEREITIEQLQQEMPITKLDTLNGQYQMIMLKTQWPFNQSISKQFKVENSIEGTLATKVALGHTGWTNAMGELFRYDQNHNNNAGALKIAEAMVLQYPYSPDFYNYAGNLNAVLGNYAQSAFYYRKLFMLNNDPKVGQLAYQMYVKANNAANAAKFKQYAQ